MTPSKRHLTQIQLLLPAAVLFLSCNLATQTLAKPTPANCLDASTPVEADIEFALDYKNEVFEDGLWEKTHHVLDERVTVTWRNSQDGAITHMEYVVFPCGYDQATVDGYFSQASFEELIFQNYEGLESLDSCSEGDSLLLKEFLAQSAGIDYRVQFWIVLDHPTRILDIFIAYPADQELNLQHYAGSLFPSIPAC